MKLVSFLSKVHKDTDSTIKSKADALDPKNRVIAKASRSPTGKVGSSIDQSFESFVPIMLPPDLLSPSQSYICDENSNPNVLGNFSLFENQIDAPSIKSNNPFRRRSKVQAPQSQTPSRFDTPTIRYINGKRVTIVNDKLKVFIVDLLDSETCDLVRTMTDNHVREVIESGQRQPTWRTLYTYTKQDLPCNEVKSLNELVTNQIMADIKAIIGEIFENPREAAKLRPRSWKEPHLLLYQKLDGVPEHTGVEMHYDGCDITWNCMLSKSSEYQGGGTYFRSLRKTIRLEQGQVLVHPGELYHKGIDITNGVRSLIVCFLDGFNINITDPSSSQEDEECYHHTVCSY